MVVYIGFHVEWVLVVFAAERVALEILGDWIHHGTAFMRALVFRFIVRPAYVARIRRLLWHKRAIHQIEPYSVDFPIIVRISVWLIGFVIAALVFYEPLAHQHRIAGQISVAIGGNK